MPVWLLKEITKQRREDQKHLEPAYGTTEPTSHTLADSVEYIMPDEFYSEKKKYLKANSISLMKGQHWAVMSSSSLSNVVLRS